MTVCKVSIICPVYNEEKFIERCIKSIVQQDYPQDSLEMLFIDGRSTDRTRAIIEELQRKYSNIRLLDNAMKVVPYALNKGIKESTGDVVMRIDGHCSYPRNYVSELVKQLYELDADNVGGVWNTMPAKDTAVCHAVALASSHRFGVGGSMHKIGAKEIEEADTVPFGCYRREVFEKIGMFDTDLIRNQDDEFNGRLINRGGKIFLIPHVVIDYTARDSFAKMRKMYYQYGLFKPLVNKKLGAPATTRQFFPLLFVVGLVVGGMLSVFFPIIRCIYLAVLAIYFLIGLMFGCKEAVSRHKPALALLLPYTFLNIHICYGIGYLQGIFKVLRHQSFKAESNR